MNKKVGMLLPKSTDTRGVGISSMRKSIYLLKTIPSSHTPIDSTHTHLLLTTPTSHTHTFHPLSTIIVIHTLNFAQVKSMGVVSRRWVWLLGVVLRRYRYMYFLAAASLLFCSFFKCFSFSFQYIFKITF